MSLALLKKLLGNMLKILKKIHILKVNRYFLPFLLLFFVEKKEAFPETFFSIQNVLVERTRRVLIPNGRWREYQKQI